MNSATPSSATNSPSDSEATGTSERQTSELRAQGRVQRVYRERGFGFIRCTEGRPGDAGQDFFFHASGLEDCDITELEEGATVTFEPRDVAKGKRAEKIRSGL